MSKKLKYIFGAILSLMILGGCKEKMPSLGEASSAETASGTETSSNVTTAVPAKEDKETSAVTSEKSENYRAAEKTVLTRLVQKAASEGEDSTFDITDELFKDFDGDGRYELIAECRGRYWYTDGKKTEILLNPFFNMKLGLIFADEQNVIKISTSNERYTYLYIIKNGEITELEASGKFGSITADGNGGFTAVSHDYDSCINENRDHTWKPYWLYFEDGDFKEYVGEKISKADFMKYTGGKAALDKIENDGGTVTDILYRENGIVNINYTVTKNDTEYNKFYIYDVSGGDCKEIKALFENRENDYGVYLPSALKPYSDEQLALHKLIETTSGGNPWDKVINPLFGDFDGDGKNELIAEYGSHDQSELWFASGGSAYKLEERVHKDYTSGGRGIPCILKSAGNVYFMVQHYRAGTLGGTRGSCDYYLIKNSSACEIGGETEQNLVPDGDYGDLISDSMTYDMFFDKQIQSIMGQTWKNYWFYFLGEEIRQYYGMEITREEFLKYDGAAAILDKIAADGKEVDEILKRGNGTVTVNIRDEDEYGIGFSYVTSKYRHGKLFVVEDDGDGVYWDKWEESPYIDYEQTDFERLSEMIYDTAEGDENSFIRERFYGDTDKDGKNELYAYYGTDEKFSLWFADDSGAKKVTENISLFYADGDVLMKNGDDYFVIKNGKSKKLDTMGAEEFSMQADGSFTGYISAGHTDSTRSEESRKLYWFRYRDGKISDCTGTDITEEELLQYGGGRAALDEIAARGGDLVNIVRRDNGIININYALHNQTTTQRFFMTLEIGADNKLTDITPKKEDGTPDNAGWYLHSLNN